MHIWILNFFNDLQDASKLEFQLFKDPVEMARSYRSLVVNVRRLLMQKSDEEGGTQFVREVQISDSPGFVHKLPELPTTHSYFIVAMLPPPDMEDDGTPLDGEVELLFSADSMYNLGFNVNDVWHVFGDAILPGVEPEHEERYNIKRLHIQGSYQSMGVEFMELIVGFDGQLQTFKSVKDFRWATTRQISHLACRNVVTFSEPIRFPFLSKQHLTNFQQGNLCAVLDLPVKVDEPYRNVSFHFTNWSNYSDRCREGRGKFAEVWERSDPTFSKYLIPGIPSFDALLNFMGVLSNKIHKKTHKEEEAKKQMKHPSANSEDRNKGAGDEDPPSDRDGTGQERRKNKDTSSAWFFEAPVMPFHWIARAQDTAEVSYTFWLSAPLK